MKLRILTPVLALLLCAAIAAATVFAVLFFNCPKENTEYKEKWENATDDKLYLDNDLLQNANIHMTNISCDGKKISFTIINNTRHAEWFANGNIRMQRLENGQWVDVDFAVTLQEDVVHPEPFMTRRFTAICTIYTSVIAQTGYPIPDRDATIPDGYYRVVLAMDDYNVVGYLNFP